MNQEFNEPIDSDLVLNNDDFSQIDGNVSRILKIAGFEKPAGRSDHETG